MTHMNALVQAPIATQYCAKLREWEASVQRFDVAAGDLELRIDGTVDVHGKSLTGIFPMADEALADAASLTEIPRPYFKDCDAELQSFSFNHRIRQSGREGQPVQIVLRNGVADRILNCNLLPAPLAAILDTVLNAKPESIPIYEVRAIAHNVDETLDVSLVVPTLSREPRTGDIVAFGVNVAEEKDGAVQVRGAAFRCWCSNGAVNRVCDSRDHRLRRPLNRAERERSFLNNVSSFAKAAWGQWHEHAEALVALTGVEIDPKDRASLRSRLTQRPFFLSQQLVNRVADQLVWEAAQHQQMASLYDLWNAMTYVGTHDRRVSPSYRMRLRLGAGELGWRGSRICNVCRQLVLGVSAA